MCLLKRLKLFRNMEENNEARLSSKVGSENKRSIYGSIVKSVRGSLRRVSQLATLNKKTSLNQINETKKSIQPKVPSNSEENKEASNVNIIIMIFRLIQTFKFLHFLFEKKSKENKANVNFMSASWKYLVSCHIWKKKIVKKFSKVQIGSGGVILEENVKLKLLKFILKHKHSLLKNLYSVNLNTLLSNFKIIYRNKKKLLLCKINLNKHCVAKSILYIYNNSIVYSLSVSHEIYTVPISVRLFM